MWPWADVWTFLASVSWCMYILAWKYRVSVTTRERPLKAETASPFLSFTLPSKSIHIQPLLTILSYQPPPYPVPYRCCKGGGSTSWQLAWLSFLRGCSLSSTQRPQWLSWTEWWWDLTDLRTPSFSGLLPTHSLTSSPTASSPVTGLWPHWPSADYGLHPEFKISGPSYFFIYVTCSLIFVGSLLKCHLIKEV